MDCGPRVIKIILFIFNGIFLVVGFVLMVLGLWLRFSENTRTIFEIQELNSSTFKKGVAVMITLGSILLIVAMFGIYGAYGVSEGEKKPATKCSLQVFAFLVAVLALAEIIVGALAYSRSKEAGEALAEFYVSLYGVFMHTEDTAIAGTLTAVHNTLHCCGVAGIPIMGLVKDTCPKLPLQTKLHKQIVFPNCPEAIVAVCDKEAPHVMGFFVGTGVFLITALVLAVILLTSGRKKKGRCC